MKLKTIPTPELWKLAEKRSTNTPEVQKELANRQEEKRQLMRGPYAFMDADRALFPDFDALQITASGVKKGPLPHEIYGRIHPTHRRRSNSFPYDRRAQAKRQEDYLCLGCGSPDRLPTCSYCPSCREKYNARKRRRL